MKKIFLILLLSILVPSLSWGATYYVDCAASTGGDGSLATPWDAIADVNAASFSAGDSILIKSGCTFREQLTVPSSGTAGSPITISAYGTGAKPIIDNLVTVNKCTNEGYNGTLNSGMETAGAGPPAALYWVETASKGTSTIARDDTTQHSGTYSLKLTYGDTLLTVSNQTRYVLPGFNYRFSYWGKTDAVQTITSYLKSASGGTYYLQDTSEAAPLQVGVPYKKTWSTTANYVIDDLTTSANTASFTKKTLDLMWYPSGTIAEYKGPYLGTGTASAGSAWIDDAKFRPLWTDNTGNVWKLHLMVNGSAYVVRQLYKNGVKLTSEKSAVENLAAEGDWCTATVLGQNVLYLYTATNPDLSSDIYEIGDVQNLYGVLVNGKSYVDITGLDILGAGSGNATYGGAISIIGSDHININDVVVRDSAGFLVFIGPSSSYVTVTNSLLYDSKNHAIRTSGAVDYITMSGNEVYNIGTRPLDVTGEGGGVGAAIGSDHVTIHDNYIHNNGYSTASSSTTDGAITVLGINNNVYNNRVDTCLPIGIAVSGDDVASSGTVHNNVLSNIGNGLTTDANWHQNAFYLRHVENLTVYNNTVYNSHPINTTSITNQAATLRLRQPYHSGVIIKNNIFHQYDNNGLEAWIDSVADGGDASLIVDNNLYYNPSGSGRWRVGQGGSVRTSISAYRTDLGVFASHEASGLSTDPRLSSTFHLLPGSPAINTGTDVGLTSDIEGKSVPYGSKPDIGAYEYRPIHFWNF